MYLYASSAFTGATLGRARAFVYFAGRDGRTNTDGWSWRRGLLYIFRLHTTGSNIGYVRDV
jgi:hypothetical protein